MTAQQKLVKTIATLLDIVSMVHASAKKVLPEKPASSKLAQTDAQGMENAN